ncbi:MAG: DivIVA domain-containing protein, partial [Acidimicrobiia bacterium]
QARSEELVSEHYVVAEAVEEANRLVRNAETESERIRLEAEDFAERHLAEAETVLGELLRYVRESRAELHRTQPAPIDPPLSE